MKMSRLFAALMLATSFSGFAQEKLMTRNAYARFFSSTPMEDIEGVNNQVSSVLDPATGNIAFQVPIKAFQFEKALMQEHFNENYMESGKIPNATFKGTIAKFSTLDLSRNGSYELMAEGTLNIHGVERQVSHPVKITVQDGVVRLESVFKVAPADHDIAIPSAVRNNIAKEVEVTIKAQYNTK